MNAEDDTIPRDSQRRLFAGLCLQGLCAAISDYSPGSILSHESMAKEAVGLADALLMELDKF
jgi:hypothetical protein